VASIVVYRLYQQDEADIVVIPRAGETLNVKVTSSKRLRRSNAFLEG
jgi:hypothetical protein